VGRRRDNGTEQEWHHGEGAQTLSARLQSHGFVSCSSLNPRQVVRKLLRRMDDNVDVKVNVRLEWKAVSIGGEKILGE
jgi:hypothetical protein